MYTSEKKIHVNRFNLRVTKKKGYMDFYGLRKPFWFT